MKKVGYCYKSDEDSITRKNNYEYRNDFVGGSAMVVKSILICKFYQNMGDEKSIIDEVCRILTLCYSRLYSSLFVKKVINEETSKIIFLLKCLIKSTKVDVYSPDFNSLFYINMYKRNYIYRASCEEENPYQKSEDFLMLIDSFNNDLGNYSIKGTNVHVDDLLDMIGLDKVIGGI